MVMNPMGSNPQKKSPTYRKSQSLAHLKNISQLESFPQVGVKIKNIWNHHLVMFHHFPSFTSTFPEAESQKKARSRMGR